MKQQTAHSIPAPVESSAARRRGLYASLIWFTGWVSLLLGFIGVILPLLPTAPFLIVAAACFARTDPAMRKRMYRLPVVGSYLSDIADGKALPPWLQTLSILFVWVSVLYAMAVLVKSLWVKIALLVMAVVTTLHVLLLGRGKTDTKEARE
jgi:hypothetical protein